MSALKILKETSFYERALLILGCWFAFVLAIPFAAIPFL